MSSEVIHIYDNSHTRSWERPDLLLPFQCSMSSSRPLAVCIPVVVISHPFTSVSVLFSLSFSPPSPFLVSAVLPGIVFLVSVVLSLFRGISFVWIIVTDTVFVFVLHLQDMHLRLDQVTHYLQAKGKKGTLRCIQNCIRAKWPIRPAQVIFRSCSMKRLGLFLLPPGWDSSPYEVAQQERRKKYRSLLEYSCSIPAIKAAGALLFIRSRSAELYCFVFHCGRKKSRADIVFDRRLDALLPHLMEWCKWWRLTPRGGGGGGCRRAGYTYLHSTPFGDVHVLRSVTLPTSLVIPLFS